MRLRLLIALLGLLVVPGGLCAEELAARTSAPELTVHYDLYTGGLRTLGIDAKAYLKGDRYSITADIRSIGFLNWLFAYHARHEVDGLLIDRGVHPEHYANMGEWNGGARSVEVRYGTRGPVSADIEPAADADKREPVPKSLWAGTIDPLSLVLAVNREADADHPCSVNVPVFDGRRRYDLHLQPLGTERLTANYYSAFTGSTLKCRVVWERIAGESRHPQWQPKRPPLTTVWLARFGPGRLWLPVRLETESGFGHVVGHIGDVSATESVGID